MTAPAPDLSRPGPGGGAAGKARAPRVWPLLTPRAGE